jgi:hypothetical protein
VVVRQQGRDVEHDAKIVPLRKDRLAARRVHLGVEVGGVAGPALERDALAEQLEEALEGGRADLVSPASAPRWSGRADSTLRQSCSSSTSSRPSNTSSFSQTRASSTNQSLASLDDRIDLAHRRQQHLGLGATASPCRAATPRARRAWVGAHRAHNADEAAEPKVVPAAK